MKVQFENYTLEPEEGRFNLFITVPSKGKTPTVTHNMGYSMRFETCIERIIQDKIENTPDVISLREYIDLYKATSKEVMNVLT